MDIASKSTGDSLSAAEFNQVVNELENALSSTGQSPSAGDVFQIAKAITDYAAHGDFYTDSGGAGAYVLSALGSKQDPTAYADGMRVRFVPGNTNTGASTVNVASLGVKNIKTPSGADPIAGTITSGVPITLQYDSGAGYFIIYSIARGADYEKNIRDISRGLIIGNNSTNPAFQVDVDADEIMLQDTNGFSFRATSVNETADITASGANGLDTGSEASDTWYFIWVIAKADGTIDSLLSISSTSPTMPSGYIYKALAGAIYNDSSSDFITIRQDGNIVQREVVNVLSSGSSTSYVSIDLSAVVPTTAVRVMGVFSSADSTSLANPFTNLANANELNRVRCRAQNLSQSMFTPFEASADLYYSVGQATTSADVEISGWKY